MIRWLLDDWHATLVGCGGALARLGVGDPLAVARLISELEEEGEPASPASERLRRELDARRKRPRAPVVGFTGTGGSGKSSVVDEIVCRFRLEHPERSVGLLLVDPSRRRSGGALLGDRIRMNAIHGPGVFARSLAHATRTSPLARRRRRRSRAAGRRFRPDPGGTAGIGRATRR
jgi:methylmalonyl-CoA mutase